MENNIDIEEIREYMDKTIKKMGDIFSHFTITIWVNGHTTESGLVVETDYDLMLVPEHNLTGGKFFDYIKSHNLSVDILTSMNIDRFPMYKNYSYTPGDAFREAQQTGRKLYFALRKEYPIHRKLGYND